MSGLDQIIFQIGVLVTVTLGTGGEYGQIHYSPAGSNVGIPSGACESGVLEASHKSEEPLSSMTLYDTGGVPTAMEPK